MKFKGWKQIFSFNYLQQIKSKSFIISTIIICVLIVALAILISVVSFSGISGIFGEIDSDELKPINTLYVYNQTNIPNINLNEENIKCVILENENEFEQKQEDVKVSENPEALMNIFYNGEEAKEVQIKLYHPKNEVVGSEYMKDLSEKCRDKVQKSLLF